MSVGKIALGVFLGNLMFGVIAWIVLSFTLDRAETRAAVAQTDAQYQAMQARPH
jgi:hypothetical protein